MNFKKIVAGITFLLIAVTAMAQDKIIKKNGETINAKISLINADIIVFKRFDNPDGPEYTIPKGDVAKIKYANGTSDIFEENNDRIGVEKGKENIKSYNEAARNKNILGFAPLIFTEHGWGVGINWEHSLDKQGWVTINVPAEITWDFTPPDGVKKDPLFYLMPGIKVYPNLNGSSKSKFSVGPSLVFALGMGTPSAANYYGENQYHETHMMMGAMAVIGTNLFPTEHTYLGAEFGLGYSYFNQYNGNADPTTVLLQISLKCGYKYVSKLKKKVQP